MPDRRSSIIPGILSLAIIVLLLYLAGYFLFYKSFNTHISSFGSIAILNRELINPGYTLISPYNRFPSVDQSFAGEVFLLDLLGRPVHSWTTKHQALYSIIEPNGRLLVTMEEPAYPSGIPLGGNTGIIQELDWDSKVVWEYKNDYLHHDFVPLENGNIAAVYWEKTPDELVPQIKGGVSGTEVGGQIWSDAVVEINREGKIVWTWHSYEHMDVEQDIIGPMMPRSAWTYVNGLKYLASNPIDGQEAYLLSMRQTDTVLIFRKKDGQIIWRSPKGMLNTQHDPTMLENGNILVFDNGLYRQPNPNPDYGSRVVEIDPRLNKIVWQFDGGQTAVDKVKFWAPIVGGAQRLKNGNTLITDGVDGHVFEVTPSEEIVWDFVSPYKTKTTGHFSNNFLFKTRRYESDEIKWPHSIKPPVDDFELSLFYKLRPLYSFTDY